MEITYNFTDGKYDNKFIERLILDDKEIAFDDDKKSFEKNYVVFDGTTKELFSSDLEECYIYCRWYRKFKGFWPEIYSRRKYVKMIEDFKKYY